MRSTVSLWTLVALFSLLLSKTQASPTLNVVECDSEGTHQASQRAPLKRMVPEMGGGSLLSMIPGMSDGGGGGLVGGGGPLSKMMSMIPGMGGGGGLSGGGDGGGLGSMIPGLAGMMGRGEGDASGSGSGGAGGGASGGASSAGAGQAGTGASGVAAGQPGVGAAAGGGVMKRDGSRLSKLTKKSSMIGGGNTGASIEAASPMPGGASEVAGAGVSFPMAAGGGGTGDAAASSPSSGAISSGAASGEAAVSSPSTSDSSGYQADGLMKDIEQKHDKFIEIMHDLACGHQRFADIVRKLGAGDMGRMFPALKQFSCAQSGEAGGAAAGGSIAGGSVAGGGPGVSGSTGATGGEGAGGTFDGAAGGTEGGGMAGGAIGGANAGGMPGGMSGGAAGGMTGGAAGGAAEGTGTAGLAGAGGAGTSAGASGAGGAYTPAAGGAQAAGISGGAAGADPPAPARRGMVKRSAQPVKFGDTTGGSNDGKVAGLPSVSHEQMRLLLEALDMPKDGQAARSNGDGTGEWLSSQRLDEKNPRLTHRSLAFRSRTLIAREEGADSAGFSSNATSGRRHKRSPSPLMGGVGSMLGGGVDGGGGGAAAAGGCPPMQLIFARGTTEIQGTFGIVGRPLCNGLQQQVPGTKCYDVVYSSDMDYFVAPSQGAAAATSEMSSISSRCPSTKFLLGGYSKGAMVVHLIKQAKNVVGAVTFGDPYKMMPVPTTPNWKLFCHMGDPVCENGMNVMAHLTYSMEDINAAVSFLVQAYRSSGGGGGSGAAGAAAGGNVGGADGGGSGAGGAASPTGGAAGTGLGGLSGLGGLNGLGGLSGLFGKLGSGGSGGGGLGGLSGLGLKKRSSAAEWSSNQVHGHHRSSNQVHGHHRRIRMAQQGPHH